MEIGIFLLSVLFNSSALKKAKGKTMAHSKKVMTTMVALALVFVLSANAAKKKEAPTTQDAVAKIDLAIQAIKDNSKSKATKLLNEASGILRKLPESEEVSEAKGYYYQTMAEMAIFVNGDSQAFEKNKQLCVENSKNYGAEITYLAAGLYYDVAGQLVKNAVKYMYDKDAVDRLTKEANKFYADSRKAFLEAFELDSEFSHISNDDMNKFMMLSKLKSNFDDMAIFYDKFFASKNTFYFEDLGSNATAIYEITREGSADRIHKAILISILDFETKESPNGTSLVAILEKNFSKYADTAPTIGFVKKFYSDAAFSQKDLDALPAEVRDFLPVRYMYKMKTSNDVAALKAEFEPFFTGVKYYQKRLEAKTL